MILRKELLQNLLGVSCVAERFGDLCGFVVISPA